MALQEIKQKVKDFVKHRNVRTQYAFYQCLFDGKKAAALSER